MQKIKFSIIIPYYNTKEEYFTKCLDSAKNQKYQNIQVIIVDNSTAEFKPILKNYKKLENFEVIEQTQHSVSLARNNGILSAKGDYIIFLDADDWLNQTACSTLNKIIINNNYPDIVIGKSYLHQEDKFEENKSSIKEGEIKNKQELIDSIFLNNNNKFTLVEVPWAKAYKREFLLKNNIYFDLNLSNGEDVVFNYEAYKQLCKIYYTNEIIYNYRFNQFSVCASFCPNLDKKFELLSKILRKKIYLYKSTQDLKNLYIYNIRNICRLLRKYYNKSSSFKVFKREFLNLLQMEEFKLSLSSVKMKHLDKGKRLVVCLCRLKLLRILYKMSKKGFRIK